MKSTALPLSLAATLLAAPFARADLFINEVLGSTTSTDSEFIELYNSGGTPVDITGWTLEVYESDAGASFGDPDDPPITFGTATIAAGDYFLIGSPQFTTDFGITPDQAIPNNFLENSSYTLILRDAAMTIIYSAFVTDGGAGDAANDAGALITPDFAIGPDGTFLPAGFALTPDGGTSSILLEYSPKPAPSATPGAANPIHNGPLSLVLDTSSIPEDGSTSITATVSTTAPVSGDLNVTVTISDKTEADSYDATIFDGATEGLFTIDAVDDFWPDGDQTVTVTVSAPTYDPADETFTVTDNDSGFKLLINEVYYAADGSLLDANNDGSADTGDEFIEIVNVSGAPLDLTGVSIHDSSFPRHVFSEGTILKHGQAVVVFGLEDVPQGSTSAFGTAEIQAALVDPMFPGLRLGDDGSDLVRLEDTDGTITGVPGGELHLLPLPDQTGSPTGGSLTSATDLDPSGGYVLHTTTTPATPYSPGTMIDGTPFLVLTDQLILDISPTTYTEGDDFIPMAGTVAIPAPIGSDLIVNLDSSDPGEIDTSAVTPVIITAGTTSTPVSLFVVDDVVVDGTQTSIITARASGYLNDTAEVEVEDFGDVPVFTDLVINEIDADQEGTDSNEFVELYNNTAASQSMNGLCLVLINGNGDTVYRAIDLTGMSIPGDGFFVVGSATVPNVNLVASPATNLIQNGADAVALYIGSAAEFPSGTPLATITNTLVDAVVYGTSDGDDAELLAGLTPGQPQVDENANGSGTTEAIARASDGGSAFDSSGYVTQAPTPGSTNVLSSSDFADWLTANGYAATGFDADSDLDGDSNGAEWYFFGSSPDAPSNNGSAVSEVTPAAAGSFTFSHRRPLNRNGVTEAYQYSLDLDGTWNPSDATVTISPGATVADVPGYEIVTVTVTVNPSTTPKVFVRLALSEAP